MSDETEKCDQDAIDAARLHGESGNVGTPPSGEPPATAGRSSRAGT